MMRFSLLSLGWQLKLVGSVAFGGGFLIPLGEKAWAQIVSDNTLGAESSVLSPLNFNIKGIPSDRIEGGATRGANLFHSFQEFNVNEGRAAYFANPIGIENILTRVTGGNPSNIFGRLGVLGKANLFLLNPNGIVFGLNASLDVQGSFFATTANEVKLGDTGLFSASEPETSNLLTVNPSAFLFNAIAAQPIVIQSQAFNGMGQPNFNESSPGLEVPIGQTLGFIGGDLRFEGRNLTAAEGRIELGSVASVGEVSLNQIGNQFVLGYETIQEFGQISLSNRAFIDASGEGGGDVQIRAKSLEMTQGSLIFADTLGAGGGGEVRVKTSESVSLREGSRLTADVASSGTGTGGNLTIDTSQLLVLDGAQVSATTFGDGNGGSLQVTANTIELIGRSADGQFPSALYTRTQGKGDAGDLTIHTLRLLVLGGAQVLADTISEGNGGSLQVTANTIELIGRSADGQFPSALYTSTDGKGNARDLTIHTSRLLVLGGARVDAGATSEGNGASLQVTADTIELIGTGTSADGQFLSGLFAETRGIGDAGNLTIHTSQLLVLNGARVSASTFGEGNGGSLQVTADVIEVSGTSADGQFPSGLFAETRGTRDAGNLTIDTSQLLVLNGAVVSASTRGEGNGGSLQVTADNIELIGTSADGQVSSGLYTSTGGTGNAGNLTINTSRLLVLDGAVVFTGSRSIGNGGALQVTATDSIELIGTSVNGLIASGVFTSIDGTGNAGNLIIDTSRLQLRDGAKISSESFGQGNANNITITVGDTLEANNGIITTSSQYSSGGGITITADQIRLYGNSDITTNVNEGIGGAGNISLKGDSILAFDDSDILAFARDGKGGNITFKTPAFFGQNYRPASGNTNPATLDNNNRVDVNATGAVSSGAITLPDVSFIQNNLTELPENQINTDRLLANSCIVRQNEPTQGSFMITGSGGLPQSPGDASMSTFPTVDLETLPTDSTPSPTNPHRSWQKGDPIIEPQGLYRLPNGKLVLSRNCS